MNCDDDYERRVAARGPPEGRLHCQHGSKQHRAVHRGAAHCPRRIRRRGANRGGEILERHPLRREARRLGDDLDLADVARLHVDPPDTGDPRDQRLDLIAGNVVKGRRIAAFEVV